MTPSTAALELAGTMPGIIKAMRAGLETSTLTPRLEPFELDAFEKAVEAAIDASVTAIAIAIDQTFTADEIQASLDHSRDPRTISMAAKLENPNSPYHRAISGMGEIFMHELKRHMPPKPDLFDELMALMKPQR